LYSKFKIVADYIIAQNSLNPIWGVKTEKWQKPKLMEPAKAQPLVCRIYDQAAGATVANAN
jgi:hypothetical protein